LPLSFLGFLAIGAVIGGMSGMFGIGGIAAFWQYYKAGLVNVPAVLLLVAGFLAGSYLSAGYAIGLPSLLLKRAFGGLMIVTGVIYVLTAK